MKTVACITFTPAGLAEGLYTEVIDLASIGKLRVRRATWITFDHELQAWRVRDRSGLPLFTAPTRRACLEWEQRYFMEYGLKAEMETTKHPKHTKADPERNYELRGYR